MIDWFIISILHLYLNFLCWNHVWFLEIYVQCPFSIETLPIPFLIVTSVLCNHCHYPSTSGFSICSVRFPPTSKIIYHYSFFVVSNGIPYLSVCVYVCVWICVCERERERETDKFLDHGYLKQMPGFAINSKEKTDLSLLNSIHIY